LLVALHLDDGEPMPLTRDGLPQARDSGVFALPTGAEMIVTLSPPRDRESGREDHPRRSAGHCRSYLQGMPGVYA
jgi:hypothetical protein